MISQYFYVKGSLSKAGFGQNHDTLSEKITKKAVRVGSVVEGVELVRYSLASTSPKFKL
jgi:hypothetical protein